MQANQIKCHPADDRFVYPFWYAEEVHYGLRQNLTRDALQGEAYQDAQRTCQDQEETKD